MKKRLLSLYSRLSLLIAFTLLMGAQAISQTPTDFWQAFEKCTQLSAFQSHYPTLSNAQTRLHAVMNHGVAVPAFTGVTLSSNTTFEVYDKSTMMGLNKANFFLFHDVKFDGNTATFDVVYYYNFNGSYDQFVAALITVEKTNGVWAVTNTTLK